MTEGQWRRIEELFCEGLNASDDLRRALLERIDDEHVAAAVRQLWADARDAPAEFLAEPAGPTVTHAVGTLVDGRFELTTLLGVGGMGEVFAATDTRLGRTVALKFLNRDLALHAGMRVLLEREARALCRLAGHPGICTVHDLRWADDGPFLLMEYLPGETLAARLARGAMSVADAVTIGVAISGGLEYAHRCGVIHRDVKPANVMLTPFGPKLFDFGIARAAGATGTADMSTLLVPGAFIGSPSYTSPEQAEGLPVDARTDIFSLGCVLYEMVTGVKAFDGATRLSVLAAVLRAEPRRIREIIPAVPAEYEHVVASCLVKAREGRWPGAFDVQQALQQVPMAPRAADLSISATGPAVRRDSGAMGQNTPGALDPGTPQEPPRDAVAFVPSILVRGSGHPVCLVIAVTHGLMVGIALPLEVAYEWPQFAGWAVPVGVATGVLTAGAGAVAFTLLCREVVQKPAAALVKAAGVFVMWSVLLASLVSPQLPDRPLVLASIQTMTASVGYAKCLLEALALPLLVLVPIQVVCLLEGEVRAGRSRRVHRILTSAHPALPQAGALFVSPQAASVVFATVTIWWIAANARLLENLHVGPYFGLFLRLNITRATSGLCAFLAVLLWYIWTLNEMRRVTAPDEAGDVASHASPAAPGPRLP